jgi:hypothetical protein
MKESSKWQVASGKKKIRKTKEKDRENHALEW